VDGFDGGLRQRPAPHIRLIRRDDEQKTCFLQPAASIRHFRIDFKLFEPFRRIRFPVTNERTVQDAIAIQKHSLTQCLRHAVGSYRTLSHLVWLALSLGCETSRCQITA
jgi:hypothetical protein